MRRVQKDSEQVVLSAVGSLVKQVGAFYKKRNEDAFGKIVCCAGFPKIVREQSGADSRSFFRLQCGAFSVCGNVAACTGRLKLAGFDAINKEVRR